MLLTANELAGALGVSRSAIYQAERAGRIPAARRAPLMFEVGTTLPPATSRPITDRQRSRILGLRALGRTYAEIAEEAGCSPATVGRNIRKSTIIG